jgi:hypothetical protein
MRNRTYIVRTDIGRHVFYKLAAALEFIEMWITVQSKQPRHGQWIRREFDV